MGNGLFRKHREGGQWLAWLCRPLVSHLIVGCRVKIVGRRLILSATPSACLPTPCERPCSCPGFRLGLPLRFHFTPPALGSSLWAFSISLAVLGCSFITWAVVFFTISSQESADRGRLQGRRVPCRSSSSCDSSSALGVGDFSDVGNTRTGAEFEPIPWGDLVYRTRGSCNHVRVLSLAGRICS